jgi:hypothetical protein
MADFFMEDLEEGALSCLLTVTSSVIEINVVVWPLESERLEDFVDYVKSIHHNI